MRAATDFKRCTRESGRKRREISYWEYWELTGRRSPVQLDYSSQPLTPYKIMKLYAITPRADNFLSYHWVGDVWLKCTFDNPCWLNLSTVNCANKFVKLKQPYSHQTASAAHTPQINHRWSQFFLDFHRWSHGVPVRELDWWSEGGWLDSRLVGGWLCSADPCLKTTDVVPLSEASNPKTAPWAPDQQLPIALCGVSRTGSNGCHCSVCVGMLHVCELTVLRNKHLCVCAHHLDGLNAGFNFLKKVK